MTKILHIAFKYALPLLISVGLCYLLFTKVSFGDMMDKIKDEGNNLWWIALALFISVFSHIFRAMRWRIQLRALEIKAPLSALINSIFGTYAVNLVLPRLGELWRSGYIAQRQKSPVTIVLGSMVAERCADMLTVLLLVVITFLCASDKILDFVQKYPDSYARIADLMSSPWLWCGIVAVIAMIIMLFKCFPQNAFVGKVKGLIKGLWDGFVAIAKMKGKVKWLFLTAMIWGCYFIQLYVAFFAFPETSDALEQNGIIVALVCFVLSCIAMGIPVNGGIGPWQIAVMFGLSMYGVSELPAMAFANVVLGTETLLTIVLGLYTFVAISLDRKKGQK